MINATDPYKNQSNDKLPIQNINHHSVNTLMPYNDMKNNEYQKFLIKMKSIKKQPQG